MSFIQNTFETLKQRQIKLEAARGNKNTCRNFSSWWWTDKAVDFIGHLQEELIEVKRELPHKWWKEAFAVNVEALLSELADVYIHWVNLCNVLGGALGFDHFDVMAAVYKKLDYNNSRSDQAVDTLDLKVGAAIEDNLTVTPFTQEQLKSQSEVK